MDYITIEAELNEGKLLNVGELYETAGVELNVKKLRFVSTAKKKYGHDKPSSPKGVCHDHSYETIRIPQ